MSKDRIAECKKSIQGDLSEILAVLDFAVAAFRTYASSGDLLAWLRGYGEQDLSKVIDEFRTLTRITDLNLFFQSLFVQIWSTFELAIRNLILGYLDECYRKHKDFSSLQNAKIIERNLYHSGVALQQVFENRSHLDLKFFEIAKNIGTSIPSSADVKLNAVAFTLFSKGPSALGIEEALTRIGISKFDWDALGKIAEVQKVFGTRKVRETTNQIKDFLAQAERTRNHIVHRGENIQPITESQLREHAAKFEVLANGIADHLQQRLDKI